MRAFLKQQLLGEVSLEPNCAANRHRSRHSYARQGGGRAGARSGEVWAFAGWDAQGRELPYRRLRSEEGLVRPRALRASAWAGRGVQVRGGGGGGGNDRDEGEAEGRAGSRAEGTMQDGAGGSNLQDNNDVNDTFSFDGWQKRTTAAIFSVWRRIKAAFGDG